jgi:hypothetical protein
MKPPVSLKDALEALRVELSESILLSEGKQVRFKMQEVEMEFQVSVEASADVKGGVKFAVDVGGGSSVKGSVTHKLKFKLQPIYADGGPVLTGSEEERE